MGCENKNIESTTAGRAAYSSSLNISGLNNIIKTVFG